MILDNVEGTANNVYNRGTIVVQGGSFTMQGGENHGIMNVSVTSATLRFVAVYQCEAL